MHWWMLYGILTALTVGLAFSTPPSQKGVRLAAYLLAATWLLSNISFVFAQPYHGQFYPLMDSVMGFVFIALWLRRQEHFLLAIGVIFIVMMSRHAIFFNEGDDSFAARWSYDRFLNIAFAAQLLCVALQCLAGKWKMRHIMRPRHGGQNAT